MPLRNGDHGYGLVTKTLHWLTVLALAAQFVVGYTMDTDGDFREAECDPPGETRSGGDTSDAEEDRLDRAEDRCEEEQDRRKDESEDGVGAAWSDLWSGDLLGDLFGDGVSGPELHVLLGLLIITLGLLRLVWRRLTPLPPWDPRLTPADQRFVHATEVTLLTLLFVVPATGIALVLGEDDLLPLHIAAHVAFFVALAAHLAMVLGKRLLPRMI